MQSNCDTIRIKALAGTFHMPSTSTGIISQRIITCSRQNISLPQEMFSITNSISQNTYGKVLV